MVGFWEERSAACVKGLKIDISHPPMIRFAFVSAAGVLILLFGVCTLAVPGGHAGHGDEHAGHGHSAHQPMPQENQE